MKTRPPARAWDLFLRPLADLESAGRVSLDAGARAFLERLRGCCDEHTPFASLRALGDEAASLDHVVRLASMGLLEIRFGEPDSPADPLQEALDTIERVGHDRPASWNRIAYEREWTLYGDSLDSLDPSSPFHPEASFQRDCYLGFFEPHLGGLPPGSPILDAGCVVGRFAVEIASRGHDLVCVDRSRGALLRCIRRLARPGLAGSARFWLGDCFDLPAPLAGPFRAVIAIELLSYVEDPARLLARLVEATVPGGLVFLSVESRHGALLGHPEIPGDRVPEVLASGIDLRPHHVFARLMLREELEGLIAGVGGLEVLEVAPLLYTAGGVLHPTFEALEGSEGGLAALRDLERRAAGDPVLAPLGRVWCVVARKKSA